MTKNVIVLFSVLFLISPLHASSNKSVDDLYDIRMKLENLFKYTQDEKGKSALRSLQDNVSELIDSISKAERVKYIILYLQADVEELHPLLNKSVGGDLRNIQENLDEDIKGEKALNVLMQIGLDIEKLFLSIEDQKADKKLRDIQEKISDVTNAIIEAKKASEKALHMQIEVENLFVVLKEGAGDTLRDIQELLGNIK